MLGKYVIKLTKTVAIMMNIRPISVTRTVLTTTIQAIYKVVSMGIPCQWRQIEDIFYLFHHRNVVPSNLHNIARLVLYSFSIKCFLLLRSIDTIHLRYYVAWLSKYMPHELKLNPWHASLLQRLFSTGEYFQNTQACRVWFGVLRCQNVNLTTSVINTSLSSLVNTASWIYISLQFYYVVALFKSLLWWGKALLFDTINAREPRQGKGTSEDLGWKCSSEKIYFENFSEGRVSDVFHSH